MAATLADVARAVGVHPGTASRALNPETAHLVKPETAKRVRRAAKRLGYVPNPSARSLKTNRTLSVGAVLPDITNPLFPPIVRGIEQTLLPAGYSLVIADTEDNADRERDQVSGLLARQVDGLILASVRLEDPVVASLMERRVPAVLVNRVEPGFAVPSVSADDATGIRLVVDHLAGLGHTRIAHVAGPSSTSTGSSRLRAFRQALAESGLDPAVCPVIHAEAYSIAAGERCLVQLLTDTPGFTAVSAANDMLALGCYDALAQRRLNCPDDMSVVGFNDMPLVDRVSPGLTTVRIHPTDLGREAARLMLERLQDPSPPFKSVLLPVSLVVRGSTGPA
jgi:LacI family transcriptional regulator